VPVSDLPSCPAVALLPGESYLQWTGLICRVNFDSFFVRPAIKDIFQSVSAKTSEGEPCCDWVGESGSGHYVKMVHNGIEYGDMQIISEAYQIMKDVLGMGTDEMAQVFIDWNKGELDSFLIEITRDILL